MFDISYPVHNLSNINAAQDAEVALLVNESGVASCGGADVIDGKFPATPSAVATDVVHLGRESSVLWFLADVGFLHGAHEENVGRLRVGPVAPRQVD